MRKAVQLGRHGAAPRGSSLVPFLRDHRVTFTGSRYSVPPYQRDSLRSLGTHVPACQVLPPTREHAAEDLANGVGLSLEAEDQLAVVSPVLYDFIKGKGSSLADRRHLATFIRQVLEMCFRIKREWALLCSEDGRKSLRAII